MDPQKPNPQQPHPTPEAGSDFALATNNVVSATECTGLAPAPILDEGASQSYFNIYPIPMPADMPKKERKEGTPPTGEEPPASGKR